LGEKIVMKWIENPWIVVVENWPEKEIGFFFGGPQKRKGIEKLKEGPMKWIAQTQPQLKLRGCSQKNVWHTTNWIWKKTPVGNWPTKMASPGTPHKNGRKKDHTTKTELWVLRKGLPGIGCVENELGPPTPELENWPPGGKIGEFWGIVEPLVVLWKGNWPWIGPENAQN